MPVRTLAQQYFRTGLAVADSSHQNSNMTENKVPHWQAIRGFFDFHEVYLDWATKAKDGDIFVEVGSYLGASACYFGTQIKRMNKKVTLLCVDTWPSTYIHPDAQKTEIEAPFETFYANVRQSGLTKIIVPIRAESLWAAKFVSDDLSGVFIDGNHEYESVKSDLNAWFPKTKRGYGFFAGHDYSISWPGVIKAVDEFFHGKDIKIVGQCWNFTCKY